MTIIQAKHLSKVYQLHRKQPGLIPALKSLFVRRYDYVEAVQDLSLTVHRGEMVGFIGPNGAGKTTTLKMFSGLLYPTSGQVSVLGFDPWERRYQFLRQISLVMGQKNQLWWNLPVVESFLLFKEIYNLSESQYRRSLDFLVSTLDFASYLSVQVRKLSLGQRMKAELIASLLHQPKVLFLDEPTIGLDVVTQQKIRRFLSLYNQEFKATVILTSHYMEDVKVLANRLVIIDHGRLIYDGRLADLVKTHLPFKEISLDFLKPVRLHDLNIFPHLKIKEFQPSHAVIQTQRNQTASVAARLLQHLPVKDISIREPDLSEVVRLIFKPSSL